MTSQKQPTAAEGFERYIRWQRREEARDLEELREWQQRTIATGDPEAEQLIAALEAGWLDEKSR